MKSAELLGLELVSWRLPNKKNASTLEKNQGNDEVGKFQNIDEDVSPEQNGKASHVSLPGLYFFCSACFLLCVFFYPFAELSEYIMCFFLSW